MRVFLDHALGAPWPTRIPRPAIRTIATEDLEHAVRLAEDVVLHPARLASLNASSIAWRRR